MTEAEYAEFLAVGRLERLERWKGEGYCARPESATEQYGVPACPLDNPNEDIECTECPYWYWNDN